MTLFFNVHAKPGDLDTSFDSDGKVTASIDAGDYGNDVAIEPDRKIVVAGVSGEYIKNFF